MGGPTAQHFIWGSLRFWWAVKKNATKVGGFRLINFFFEFLSSFFFLGRVSLWTTADPYSNLYAFTYS